MPKPDQNLRNTINRRSRKALIDAGAKLGKLADSQKKTPSARKSENLKRKLNSRKENR